MSHVYLDILKKNRIAGKSNEYFPLSTRHTSFKTYLIFSQGSQIFIYLQFKCVTEAKGHCIYQNQNVNKKAFCLLLPQINMQETTQCLETSTEILNESINSYKICKFPVYLAHKNRRDFRNEVLAF